MEIIRWGCSHTDRYTWIGGVDITGGSILQRPGNAAGNSQIGRERRSLYSSARIRIRGANDIGSGVTVPKNGEDYDLKNLTACAKRLKNANASFKEETQVTITANPGVEYKTVIDVMDSLRNDGEEELFPEVHFGVAR